MQRALKDVKFYKKNSEDSRMYIGYDSWRYDITCIGANRNNSYLDYSSSMKTHIRIEYGHTFSLHKNPV